MKWILLLAFYTIDPATGLYTKQQPAAAYFDTPEQCAVAREKLVNKKINDREFIIGKCTPIGERT